MPIDVDILIQGIDRDVADIDRLGESVSRAFTPRSLAEITGKLDAAKAKLAQTEQEAKALAATFQQMKLSGAPAAELQKVGAELRNVKKEYGQALSDARALGNEQIQLSRKAAQEQAKLAAEAKRQAAEALLDQQRLAEANARVAAEARRKAEEQVRALAPAQVNNNITAFDRPVQGPMTQEQYLEGVRKKTEALGQTLNQTRGWIGDVGDMFDYAGAQLLGFSGAQAKAISTTIMTTEKGMALGEVFGPQGAIIGGVAGAFVGLATAQVEAARSYRALQNAATEYRALITQKKEIEEMQRQLQITYLGVAKVTNELGKLSKVNVSDATKQMAEFNKVVKTDGGAFDYASFARARQAEKDLLLVFQGATDDKIAAIAKMGTATQELSAIQSQAQAKDTQDQSSALGRWAEAKDAVKTAKSEIQAYGTESARIAAEIKRQRDEAAAAYAADPTQENYKKLIAVQDRAAVVAQGRSQIGNELLAKESRAIARATEMQGKYQAIVEAAPSAIDKWGKALVGIAEKADSAIAGGAFKKTLDALTPANMAKAKAALEEAAQRAKATREFLQGQEDRLESQQKILEAYRESGVAAGEFEKAVQAAMSGKDLSPAQEEKLRNYVAQTEAVNKLIEVEAKREEQQKKSLEIIKREIELRRELRETAQKFSEELQSQLDTSQTLGTRRNDELVNVLLTQGPEAFEKALTSYQKLEAEQQQFYNTARGLEQIKPIFRDFFENVLVTEGKSAYDRALADFDRFKSQFVQTAHRIADPLLQVFGVLGGAIEQNIAAGYKAFDGLGIAAQRAVADLLKAKGREYAVKAIGEAGEGFAMLALGRPDKAAQSFQASVLHGIAAAAAGAGGIALGGSAGARQRKKDDARNGGRGGSGIDGGPRLSGVEDATKVQSATVINLKVYSLTPGTQREWEETGKRIHRGLKAFAGSGAGK